MNMKTSIKYKLIFVILGISGIQLGLFIFSVINNVDISFLNFYKFGASLGLFLGGIGMIIFSIALLSDLRNRKVNN